MTQHEVLQSGYESWLYCGLLNAVQEECFVRVGPFVGHTFARILPIAGRNDGPTHPDFFAEVASMDCFTCWTNFCPLAPFLFFRPNVLSSTACTQAGCWELNRYGCLRLWLASDNADMAALQSRSSCADGVKSVKAKQQVRTMQVQHSLFIHEP